MAIITCVTTPIIGLAFTVNYVWHLPARMTNNARPLKHSSFAFAFAAQTASSISPYLRWLAFALPLRAHGVTGPKPSGAISYVVREPTLIDSILLGSVLVHSAALLSTPLPSH
jgi:hypothetical protein